MACVFFGIFVRHLLQGTAPSIALKETRSEFAQWYNASPEYGYFRAVMLHDLSGLPEGEVVSSGYVVHTLHASLWCVMNSSTYSACVLKAVNLGGDSDTTGCVAGGLAGVIYGVSATPLEWKQALPNQAEVGALLDRFSDRVAETKSGVLHRLSRRE